MATKVSYSGDSLQSDSIRVSSDGSYVKHVYEPNEIGWVGCGKCEEHIHELDAFLFQHVGESLSDLSQKTKDQIDSLLVERHKQMLGFIRSSRLYKARD